MKQTYDLIVIGSGTAAQVASARMRSAGWTVAIIDHRPFGGTCALRGCDPKKMITGSTPLMILALFGTAIIAIVWRSRADSADVAPAPYLPTPQSPEKTLGYLAAEHA